MASRTETMDVIVVGAGIMGLAQAWAAARLGKRVLVLEQSRRSQGASIRNFGMIWPIGQPPGDRLDIALASRSRWLELSKQTGIYLRNCGSLFAAIDEDEASVMRDFAVDAGHWGYDVDFLTADQTHQRSGVLNRDHVVGGLFSRTELNVDPVQATAALADHLVSQHDVQIRWGQSVAAIDDDGVVTHLGDRFESPRILVCQGDVAAHLFPQHIRDAEAVSCKLHMLASDPVQADLGPMLATGLTLRHYKSFASCQRLKEYSDRISRDQPDLDRYGIHVMISQDSGGRWILGDSHQYGEDIGPFHEEAIDHLIVSELQKRFILPEPVVSSRWQGYYLKRPGHTVLVADVSPAIRIVNGLGGNGMTLSFGIAEAMWSDWEDPRLLAGLPDPDVKVACRS